MGAWTFAAVRGCCVAPALPRPTSTALPVRVSPSEPSLVSLVGQMPLFEILGSGVVGAAVGSSVTYAGNQRASRRAREEDAADQLAGLLGDVRVFATSNGAPWRQDQVRDLLATDNATLYRYLPRLERHPRLVIHTGSCRSRSCATGPARQPKSSSGEPRWLGARTRLTDAWAARFPGGAFSRRSRIPKLGCRVG